MQEIMCIAFGWQLELNQANLCANLNDLFQSYLCKFVPIKLSYFRVVSKGLFCDCLMGLFGRRFSWVCNYPSAK